MGLAAGINFSLRSVGLAAGFVSARPSGAAAQGGRNSANVRARGAAGLDETGFVLVTANELRLLDARACHLSRSGAVDWSALLGLMTAAAQHQRDPFREAVRVQERLFTTKPIFLGVEESLKHPDVPCGFEDRRRTRPARPPSRGEMRNSRGKWERILLSAEKPVREIFVMTGVAENAAPNAEPENPITPELRPRSPNLSHCKKSARATFAYCRKTTG